MPVTTLLDSGVCLMLYWDLNPKLHTHKANASPRSSFPDVSDSWSVRFSQDRLTNGDINPLKGVLSSLEDLPSVISKNVTEPLGRHNS